MSICFNGIFSGSPFTIKCKKPQQQDLLSCLGKNECVRTLPCTRHLHGDDDSLCLPPEKWRSPFAQKPDHPRLCL